MIDSTRFLVSQRLDPEGWLEIRNHGISATEVASASTPAGYRDVIENRLHGSKVEDNDYMRFGREQEPLIAMWLKDRFGIMPNDWSICHRTEPHFRATPDGLKLDHTEIAEIKTTGKDWGENIPIRYRRQIQWQMYVTDTEKCWFAYMLRVDSPQGFVPGWLEPKWTIVERDDNHINELVKTANQLWTEIQDAR